MVDNLPKSGVSLVVENQKQSEQALKRFQSQIDSISTSKAQSQLNNLQKTISGLGGKSSNLQFGKIFNNLKGVIGDTVQGVGKAVPGFDKLTTVMGASSAQSAQLATALGTASIALGAIAVATVGAAVAFGGFLALGKRGAEIQPTITAFGNLASQYGDSTEFLNKLRRETKGTTSDLKLMQIATFALSGASKELGTTLFNDLGKNLADVSQLATALGRDPVEAQTRWIDAIKKGERELLDELGIIVSADEAYARYAESINKSAGALTESEKKSAFAAEASRQLSAAVAKLGDTGSMVMLTFQKATAFLQNTLDRLSLAIQPAFAPLVGIFDAIISGASELSSFVFPVIKTLAEIVGTTLTTAFDTAKTVIDTLFGGIGSGAGKILPYAIALFQIFGDVAQSAIKGIGATIQSSIRNFASLAGFLLKPLGKVGDFISNLFKGTNDQFNNAFEQLAFNVGRGGANIVGAFAAGLLRGGAKVAEAAAKIAQIVADFLVGFSPPKKGALSQIDQGAANIAKAFAEGFTGGILPPVDQVAAQIDQRLGTIGSFSLDQIKQAFGRLDLAIRPFTEQLQLAKADLEAIAGFIDPALKIAERQRKNLLKAFGRGESVDIDTLRLQDSQIERLKELKDLETDRVDQAELQLGLVTAAQSSERALLAIQQARLGNSEDATKAIEDQVKEAKEAKETLAKEAKGAGGSGGGEPTGDGDTGGFTPGDAPDLLDNSAIANAKKQILAFGAGIAGAASQGISQGLAESGFNSALAQFQGATGGLKSQLSRAASANPAKSILDKFSGLTAGVSDILNPFKEEFDRVFGALFGEGGSISGFVTRYGTLLSEVFVGEGSLFQAAKNALADFGNIVGTALSAIDFTPLKTEINTTFGMDNEDSPFAQIGKTLGSVREKFDTFKETASQIFNALFGDKEGVVPLAVKSAGDEITRVFNDVFSAGGTIDKALLYMLTRVNGTVDAIINKFSLFTGEGDGSLRGALSSLGQVLDSAIISPFKSMANSVVQTIQNAVNAIIGTFNAADITGLLTIDPINFGQPFPGYAKGALGASGTFLAGEKGAELITTKRPATVFPAAATRAIMDMAARPMPVYAGYGASNTNYNNNSMSQTNNFNVNSPQQALLMERQMRSGFRR